MVRRHLIGTKALPRRSTRLLSVFGALLLIVAALPALVRAGPVPTAAEITSLTTSCSGTTATATGSYQAGITSATFSLARTDISVGNSVDFKWIGYSAPYPKQVTETWHSTVTLTPGVPYAVGFQIWNRGSLIAYAPPVHFTCT